MPLITSERKTQRGPFSGPLLGLFCFMILVARRCGP
nr:MAG TPA: Mature oligodendrocyte transmembrane protein [Caudoviricetes sp.]